MKTTPLWQKYANSDHPDSFSNKFRNRRMNIFEKHFPEVSSDNVIQILDVGGSSIFWKQRGYEHKNNIKITLLNLETEHTFSKNICSIAGDACDLSRFYDNQFDIVFSNSVIEHVGNIQRQKQLAIEIKRVGKGYFLQTPNYWFPMEPHFFTFGYQYMPLWLRSLLIHWFNLGAMGRQKDMKKAFEIADSIHLLSKKQLKKLFPDAKIFNEYCLGFTKSFIAFKPIQEDFSSYTEVV